MNPHYKKYLHYLLSRNRSSKTVESYLCSIKYFHEVIGKTPKEIITKAKSITESDIEKYSLHTKEKFSRNTLIPKYSAIKNYLRYLQKYKHLKIKYDEEILKSPVAVIPDKDILTHEEVERIFKANESNLRNYAILKTLRYSVQRSGAIANLNLDDINYQHETMRVRTKGNREYTVDLHPDAIESIRNYIDNERPEPREGHENALFLSSYGKRLGGWSIWNIVKTCSARAKITKRVFPHLFRATGCTHMDESGMPLPQIQAQTGHLRVESLKTYIRPDKELVKIKVRDAFKLPDTPPEEPKPTPKPKKDVDTENYIASTNEIRIKELELELLRLKSKHESNNTMYL